MDLISNIHFVSHVRPMQYEDLVIAGNPNPIRGFHVSGIVPENEFSPSCRAVRSRGVSLARGKSGFCNSGLLVGGEVCSIPAILGGTPLL